MLQVHKFTNQELHQMQRICLEMLLELDRICRKNKIEYTIDGGSLLGAVRHGGFIPWDDDVDIVFLRDEYTRFREACERDLDNNRFFLQDHTTDPEYRWGYAKMRRKDTVQVRCGQENIKQYPGVFIDIFVDDNVPDNPIVRRLHYAVCCLVRKMQYSAMGKVVSKNIFLKAWYSFLNLFPINASFAIRDWLFRVSNKKRTELVSHYTHMNYKGCKYGLPRKCFDEYVDMDFEGYKVRALGGWDEYLKKLYGDYMQLPPEEQRVSHLEFSEIKLIDVDVKLRRDTELGVQ